MFSVMYGCIIFSSVLAMGDRREIGLYDGPSVLSLCGLGIGIVLALFHMCGMLFVFSTMLNRCVRCLIAVGPKCFRCLMFMSSGPVELLFLCCFIAVRVCSVVMFMFWQCSFLMCLSVSLFALFVL